MYSKTIVPLLCKKNNISFIRFGDDYKIIEYDEQVIHLANEKVHIKVGGDIREGFWELVGLEDDIKTLYIDNQNREKSIQIPMVYKNEIYYNLEIELCEVNNEDSFMAYFTKKTEFLLSYAKMVQDMNKKTLIFQNDESARHKKEQYHNLINKKLLTFHVNIDGIITDINDTCSYFFGLEKAEMSQRHFSNFFETRESNLNEGKVLRAVNINGEGVYFHTDVIALNKEDEIYENIIICQDITYLKKIEEELAYAAGHDSLTGLANRSNLLKRIDNAITKSREENNSFAICFIDLDKFKQVNDNYGHHAGDMLLKHISKLLLSLIREEDMVSRIGGDEFIILFENINNRAYIESTIIRISETAKKTPLLYSEDDTIHFSFSLGVSYFPDGGEDAKTLLESADKEMYLRKRNLKDSR